MKSYENMVSIILCFYNEERFLKEAIQSVLTQDYSNWELILVDDGSSDKSTDIARRYAADYPRKIFYTHHPAHCNKGLSASRNEGIKIAKGNFVAFIDADDVWFPEKLSYQLAIFKKHPYITVILEASSYWKSWMKDSDNDITIPVGVKEGVYSPPQLMLSLYPLGKGAAPCPSGIIVRSMVLTRCKFEESFRGIFQMYEDQAFLCKVYLTETVFVSAACHNLYRQRPSSLVSSVHETGKYHTVRYYYLRWFSDYLKKQPISYSAVNRLVDKALMPYDQPLIYKLTHELPRIGKDIVARLLIKLGLLKYNKSW
jgi:glycosyltransferase involved in cell wall biosynthesis